MELLTAKDPSLDIGTLLVKKFLPGTGRYNTAFTKVDYRTRT
jgi:hypothetical protein